MRPLLLCPQALASSPQLPAPVHVVLRPLLLQPQAPQVLAPVHVVLRPLLLQPQAPQVLAPVHAQ